MRSTNMYFFSVIVICCLIVHGFSRPSRILEDYDREANEDSDGDSYFEGVNRQKSSLKQFPGNEANTKEDLQDEEISNSDDEDIAHSDKDYLENNNDVSEDSHGKNENLFHNNLLETGYNVKRTPEYNKGCNILFQKKVKLHKKHESGNNEDVTDGQNERAEYFKHYANTMRSVDRDEEMRNSKRFNSEYDTMTRDRRQVKVSESEESTDTKEISTHINEIGIDEDEESAIKSHIKKLTKEELDELLNSLSEEKQALLKNIIDNSRQEYDNINKREITKKAGANDENSFVGSEQSDAIKIQEGAANMESESSFTVSTENSDNTKISESGSTCSKTTEIVSSSEKSSDKVNIVDVAEDTKLEKSDIKDNPELPQGEDKIHSNTNADQDAAKNQKKREMNPNAFIQSGSRVEEPEVLSPLNNEDLYCSENEDLSQLWNEESSLYNNNNINKRACPNDEDSIKSLENSFPNGNDASSFKAGSDMAPLVRVKRKNSDKILQKRDGNFISNLKVPYFSNAAENNEEDTDEGNEFQDDGFFDRRANFAKSDELNQQDMDISTYDGESNSKGSFHNSQTVDSDNNNLETDTVSLGSDTDAVLSGIEGVDDNMMYNGVSRNKRTAEVLNNSLKNENDYEKYKQRNTIVSEKEDNEISEGVNQLSPRYQENDAFGSLPRNYEEDLGRFKRIRRLKPLLGSEKNDDLNSKQ